MNSNSPHKYKLSCQLVSDKSVSNKNLSSQERNSVMLQLISPSADIKIMDVSLRPSKNKNVQPHMMGLFVLRMSVKFYSKTYEYLFYFFMEENFSLPDLPNSKIPEEEILFEIGNQYLPLQKSQKIKLKKILKADGIAENDVDLLLGIDKPFSAYETLYEPLDCTPVNESDDDDYGLDEEEFNDYEDDTTEKTHQKKGGCTIM